MLASFMPTRADIRALVRLAIPVVTVQVGLMMLGIVDTMVVGHFSANELAAAALGNMYFFGLSVFGIGALMAIDPIVSQAMGAGDREAVALGMQRGLVMAAILGLGMSLLCLPAAAVLGALRQPPDVVPRAAAFVRVSAPSLVPLLMIVTLRQGLQAMKHTRANVITILVGNVVNLGLNLVFVFGRFGLPAMGAVGSAWSSVIGRVVMLTLLVVLARGRLTPMLRPLRPGVLAVGPLVRTLRVGLPIGAQLTVEYTTFAVIALFAGWFGAGAIGGHQVAINLASLTYMVPAGFGGAAAVLVGHAIGENEPGHARRLAASALACGTAFMSVCALVLLAIPGVFAAAFTSVPEVVVVAAALIPVAGVFQVFDGIQVVSAGILRGAGDTHAALWANLVGFWLVGTPVSLLLGFGAKLGVVGLWWGFVAGLAAVAAFLVVRVHRRLSGPLQRLSVETPVSS